MSIGTTSKHHSLETAVSLLRPVDTFGIGLGPAVPGSFMHALRTRDDWVDLQLFGALLPDLYELLLRPGVRMLSGFFGPAERFLRASGANIQFVPADFRRFAPLLRQLEPRVMATIATPPDADGWMSLSLHAGATIEELRRCGADPGRLLVVEVNPKYPRTVGLPPEHLHAIHVDEADVIVEGDRDPINLADDEPSDIDRAIAELAAHFISDGCTLQTGIGSIPTAVARNLAAGPGGDYGVHSEMFTTGLMALHKAGKVTNARKGVFDGMSISTFAAGTPELYEWLDGNDEVRFLPVDIVNSPEIIARNHRMITINGALAVDLSGQVTADTIGGEQYSGIGGHEDFISGPGLEVEDRSLICLPSTATVDGELVSRIVDRFDAGAVITTPRHQVDVIITEHGAAELTGKTIFQRAQALASIAHPKFRDELMAQAEQHHYGR